MSEYPQSDPLCAPRVPPALKKKRARILPLIIDQQLEEHKWEETGGCCGLLTDFFFLVPWEKWINYVINQHVLRHQSYFFPQVWVGKGCRRHIKHLGQDWGIPAWITSLILACKNMPRGFCTKWTFVCALSPLPPPLYVKYDVLFHIIFSRVRFEIFVLFFLSLSVLLALPLSVFFSLSLLPPICFIHLRNVFCIVSSP